MGRIRNNRNVPRCQWQVPQVKIQQWRKMDELVHPDNILLEHNIHCITQYHTKQLELTTTQHYNSCLNHTQSKDNKFIHPPPPTNHQPKRLKLSTQECNPDKDIQVNQPTIQIQDLKTNIYDQRGNYMATITLERLQWLWNQFSYHQPTQLVSSLQPPPQDYETEILWLIQRYITVLLKRKPKTIQPKNMHHTIHMAIIKTVIKSFKITHSYYSFPLTCPTQLTQYHSPHNRDKNSAPWAQHKLSNEKALAQHTLQITTRQWKPSTGLEWQPRKTQLLPPSS